MSFSIALERLTFLRICPSHIYEFSFDSLSKKFFLKMLISIILTSSSAAAVVITLSKSESRN